MAASTYKVILNSFEDVAQRAVIVPHTGRTSPMFFFKLVWDRWKLISQKIGLFQSRVILTIFYFTFILPIGIIFSIFKDVLNIKTLPNSTWIRKIKQTETLEEMRKQY